MQFSHSRARRSYGFASGEAYLSDLTLAFLEDTNQYAANYTLAGRLLPPSANPDGGALLSFLQTTSAASNDISDDLNLKVRGPGYLRWGREAGCKFLFNKPDPLENEAWPSSYTCMDTADYGCTPDNRMSALCNLKDWNAVSSQSYSCCRESECPNGGSRCHSNSMYPSLPSEMRYFGVSSIKGGYSDSMDYAPVQVGYWNCQDIKPSSSKTQYSEGNTSLDFSKVFDALQLDLQKFGGVRTRWTARSNVCRA